MRLRPTTAADLEAMHGVFRAAIGELYARRRLEPPAPPLDVFAAQHAHLLEHDGERCWVAHDDHGLAGFAAALVRDDTWFLSSLFVHPRAQGRGLGSALLDRAWAPAARRLTVTDAIQPVSNALYARRGLIPATPVLSFVGAPAVDAPPELEPAEPDAYALAVLDRAAYGFDRSRDHALWRRVATATVWRRGGAAVAYAYAWPAGALGPLAGLDGTAAGDALRAELARRCGDAVSLRVPGSAAAAVETAVAAGLRLADSPGLLLVSRPHAPPEALVVGSYTLL